MGEDFKQKLRKPEGIFYLCIVIFLNFGVYQFINDFIAIRQSENETPFLIVFLLFSFDIFCAASAVWAFFGDNWGRISLLIFMSLNMLWSIFILILTVSYAQPKENGYYDTKTIIPFVFSLLKPLVLFGISWWYFTQKDIIAYYHQDNNYEFF